MAAINGKQVKRQISSERLKPFLESRKTEGEALRGWILQGLLSSILASFLRAHS